MTKGISTSQLLKKQTPVVCFFFINLEHWDNLFCVFALSNGVNREKVTDKPTEEYVRLCLISL